MYPASPSTIRKPTRALFDTLTARITATPSRRVTRLPWAINDPRFSAALVAAFREIAGLGENAYMPRFQRRDLLQRFRDKLRRGEPIIGGGAGTGLSAKCEEAGGIDLIVLYNSGRYRMAGRGSLAGLLAYGNANEIVLEMAHEVLPVVRNTPVIAGVNGTDPFLLTEHFLSRLKDIGIAGVQNFPTVGLIDGTFRQNLEETGMGFALEVDMIRAAAALDLLTTPYVFNAADAVSHDPGRRRHHHRAYGPDHRRHDRRRNRTEAPSIALR